MLKVIHVPFTWFPAPVGGTEVYVRALIKELEAIGWENHIAVPSSASGRDYQDGVSVHRLEAPSVLPQSVLYGAGEPSSAELFRQLLIQEKPSLVHFHAFTPVISQLWLAAAKNLGIPCVYTYHTPTVACARGTLMRWGTIPCDGEMKPRRCAACALHGLGVPKPLAWFASWVSPLTQGFGSRVPFRIQPLIKQRTAAVQTWLKGMTRIIALGEWGRQVMLRNGVNAEQLAVVRHGLAVAQSKTASAKTEGVVKLGFFGRLDPTKGLDVLVKAMKMAPQLPVELHCHLIMDTASRELMKPLLDKLSQDARILIQAPVAPDEVVRTMAGYDAVLVPSTWLETGPLVVLEAFAAGVPVLGSDLGGIAEWVVDGVNGQLLQAGRAQDWAHGISRFVNDTGWRSHLRSGVQHPPLMREVSALTDLLYRDCVVSR
ncbi:MAG: hypothetical protein RL015_2718 [Verrucomicrobiota bacterium]|jgi:glycosyltransferase involved in cell wall biosynthesis